jgi:DNA replication and repair protein RecF
MSGIAPLALFDEIAAHFDPRRRAALFDALERAGGQVFLTGADDAVFAELEGRAQMFQVSAETGVRPRPSSGAPRHLVT